MRVKAGDAIADGLYILGQPVSRQGRIEIWNAQQCLPQQPPTEVTLRLMALPYLQELRLDDALVSECERLEALSHPQLQLPCGHGIWKGLFYLATPLFVGKTLRQILFSSLSFEDQPIPWPFAVHLLAELCDGLAYAYSQNPSLRSAYTDPHRLYLHGNLTPEHIGILEDGSPYLLDFGLAKIFRPRYETENGLLEGHPSYLSPEQITLHIREPSSELFSLGVILYELCAGQPPYPRISLIETLRAIQIEPAPPLSSPKQDIPLFLQECVSCLLEKHPEDRFATPAILQRVLRRILKDAKAEVDPDALALWVKERKIPVDPLEKERELILDDESQLFDEGTNARDMMKIKIAGLADDQTRPFNPALDIVQLRADALAISDLPSAFDEEDEVTSQHTVSESFAAEDTALTPRPSLPILPDGDATSRAHLLFLDEMPSDAPLMSFTPEPGMLFQVLADTTTPIPPYDDEPPSVSPPQKQRSAIPPQTPVPLDLSKRRSPLSAPPSSTSSPLASSPSSTSSPLASSRPSNLNSSPSSASSPFRAPPSAISPFTASPPEDTPHQAPPSSSLSAGDLFPIPPSPRAPHTLDSQHLSPLSKQDLAPPFLPFSPQDAAPLVLSDTTEDVAWSEKTDAERALSEIASKEKTPTPSHAKQNTLLVVLLLLAIFFALWGWLR